MRKRHGKGALLAVAGVLGALVIATTPVRAQAIAVIGDNAMDNFIATIPGKTATLVTDAQIATPGFLSGFAALVMTRNGFSFGVGLSPAAAANVAAYVGATGRVVVLNADFADDIGSAFTNGLVTNAVNYAASSGHGFVGEFNGAVSALTSNSNGFTPIGLIAGSAGALGFGGGGSAGNIILVPPGVGHAVTAGLTFPTNPGGVEFGATITGVSAPLILATFDNGNPAIIVNQGQAGTGCSTHVHGHNFPFAHGDPLAHRPGHSAADPRHGHHFVCSNHAPGHSPFPLQEDSGEVLLTTGFVAALNQDGQRNGPVKAARGGILQFFGSAAGLVIGENDEPAIRFTAPASGAPLFTTAPPDVRIGGLAAPVVFSGMAPGLTGVWQLNVQIPMQAPIGREVPVTVVLEGREVKSVPVAIE